MSVCLSNSFSSDSDHVRVEHLYRRQLRILLYTKTPQGNCGNSWTFKPVSLVGNFGERNWTKRSRTNSTDNSYTDNIGGVAWYGNHELRNPVLAPSRVSRDIASLAIFFLLIFNVLALKFLYSCFAPKENCTEAVENTLEGLIFSLMDKATENISLESLLSWRNCLKDKSLAHFTGISSLVIFTVYVPSSRVAFYFGCTLKQISLYTLLVFQNIFFGTFIPSFFSLCVLIQFPENWSRLMYKENFHYRL